MLYYANRVTVRREILSGSSKKPKVGPTGDYPQGKLKEDDMGWIAVAVTTYNNKVIIDFGSNPVKWIGMPPTEARAFAALIIKHADSIQGRIS